MDYDYELFLLDRIIKKLSTQFEAELEPIAEYVFCGIHKEYGQVAIKWASSYKQKDLLVREAMFLKGSNIQNIPHFHDFIKVDNFYFLIMSWISGSLLTDHNLCDEINSLLWLDDIKNILSIFHNRKLNHGDVKPSNIIIHNNTGFLIDFGSICQHGTAYQYMDRYSFSPKYAAYNPLAKVGRVSAADDHYSLAISVLEYLGLHYFKGKTLLEAVDGSLTVPIKGSNLSDDFLTPFYLLVNAEIAKAHQYETKTAHRLCEQ